MPCTYESELDFATFADAATLEKALARLHPSARKRLRISGANVEGDDLNTLKQAYQVEAQKLAAKKRGWLVTEKKLENGKIRLTVRA